MQGRHRLLQDFSQRSQASLLSGVGARRSRRQPAFHQPALQQRVADEPVRPMQLAEQGPNRLRELLAAESEQGGLPGRSARTGTGSRAVSRSLISAIQRAGGTARQSWPNTL